MIPPDELKIEIVNPVPPGGQHVGCMILPIRVTHIPTGIVAEVGCCRSQHRNKQLAMEMIETALTSPHAKNLT